MSTRRVPVSHQVVRHDLRRSDGPRRVDPAIRSADEALLDAVLGRNRPTPEPEPEPPTSGGVPLTDATLDALAAEAEAGYDVDRLRPRRDRDGEPS